MRKLLAATLLSATLLFSGCTAISVMTTPKEVKQSIVMSTAVAMFAANDPPTGKDLQEFLDANADCWKALCEYYGIVITEAKP